MNFPQKLQLPLFSKLINPQMVRTNNPVLFIMEKINYLTNLSMLQGGKFTLITTIAFCNSLICLFNLIMTGLHLQEHMEHWIYCNCSSSMPPLAFSLPTKSIMLPTRWKHWINGLVRVVLVKIKIDGLIRVILHIDSARVPGIEVMNPNIGQCWRIASEFIVED